MVLHEQRHPFAAELSGPRQAVKRSTGRHLDEGAQQRADVLYDSRPQHHGLCRASIQETRPPGHLVGRSSDELIVGRPIGNCPTQKTSVTPALMKLTVCLFLMGCMVFGSSVSHHSTLARKYSSARTSVFMMF